MASFDSRSLRGALGPLTVALVLGTAAGAHAPHTRAGTAPAAAPAAPLAAAALPAETPPPDARPDTTLERLPPLIDREIFFGDPEIASGQVSPDGRFISFRKPLDGVMNVWVKGIDEPFDAARPLTDDRDRPIPGYAWSRDGRWVLWVQDQGGDENFRIYAVDPAAEPAPDARVPAPRDLTPYEGIQARIIARPKDDPRHMLVGINDRDPALHDVYRLDLETGERELVFRNDENVAGWEADLEGNLRLGIRQDEEGGWEILRVDGDALTVVYTCTFEESCGPVRFHPDGRRVYMTTNKDADLTRLILFDPETGEEELVEEDPEGEVDFGGAEFSLATDELLATYYVGDRLRVYPKDEAFARDYERLREALPDGDVYLGSRTADERLWLVSVTSDVDPGATYVYDRASGEVELLYRPRPALPTEHLAEMRPIRYTARDGLEIPAYLTLPKGLEASGLRLMVVPHGGPWGRDAWGYDAIAQFLANRGYAVFQPNFRGSAGFGKAFLNAGNEEWGTGFMQHDITDGVRYLAEEGIADPERVGIMGGSYGGYATLAGLAFTPELYAAGVSIVGPSNIITLLNSIPPYWGPIRKMFTLRVGDPDDPEDRERLREQSPLFSADRIRAPLLVVQGANDPRVVKHESDQIVVALRDLGLPVAYLVAPDEGHGFARRENRLAMFTEIERFVAEHLGGRHQEGAPEEILARLETLRVDADTLSLPETDEEEAGAPAEELSLEGESLRPMALAYQTRIEAGGRELDVSVDRELATAELEGRPVWTMVERMDGPMGAAVDSVYLDVETLRPVRRFVQQGPATIEVSFGPDRVTGTMRAGAQELPIDGAVDGPVYVEGAALELALGTAGLEEGFGARYRTFDLMQGREKEHRLRVTGTEEVTVPAGSFTAVRVETSPADGSPGGAVIWIEEAAPHRVVRSETRLPPQMGGGTATSELAESEAEGAEP